MTQYRVTLFDTAIGRCGVVWGDRGIHAVQLPMGTEEKTRGRIRQRYGESTRRCRLRRCRARSTA